MEAAGVAPQAPANAQVAGPPTPPNPAAQAAEAPAGQFVPYARFKETNDAAKAAKAEAAELRKALAAFQAQPVVPPAGQPQGPQAPAIDPFRPETVQAAIDHAVRTAVGGLQGEVQRASETARFTAQAQSEAAWDSAIRSTLNAEFAEELAAGMDESALARLVTSHIDPAEVRARRQPREVLARAAGQAARAALTAVVTKRLDAVAAERKRAQQSQIPAGRTAGLTVEPPAPVSLFNRKAALVRSQSIARTMGLGR